LGLANRGLGAAKGVDAGDNTGMGAGVMGVNIEFAGIEVCEGDVGKEKAVNGRTGGSTGDTGQAPAPILGSGREVLLPLMG